MDKSKELIAKEKKLLKQYADVVKICGDAAKELVYRAAFIVWQMEILEQHIAKNGVSTTYKNGKAQSGQTTTPEAKTYNAFVQNYTKIVKQLDALRSAHCEGEPDDGFDEF